MQPGNASSPGSEAESAQAKARIERLERMKEGARMDLAAFKKDEGFIADLELRMARAEAVVRAIVAEIRELLARDRQPTPQGADNANGEGTG